VIAASDNPYARFYRLRSVCAIVALMVLLPSVGLAVTWASKSVGTLQSMYSGADCFYFTLQGVAEADPVKPGDPWFAISRGQYGAKDAYAMLLAARLTGQAVYVQTSGTLNCGNAAVQSVWIP
jgi:hypothetical protein